LAASTTPMQPRSWLDFRRVTKAPHLSRSAPSGSSTASGRLYRTHSSTLCRASRSKCLCSASVSGNIRFFPLFAGGGEYHQPARSQPFGTPLQLSPENPEILGRGNQGKQHHEPQKPLSPPAQSPIAGLQRDRGNGKDLQYHLCLAQA